MTYTEEEDEVFLGRSVTQHKHVSEETARKIDEVVRGVIDTAYHKARDLLTTNLGKLHVMADALLQYETIDAEQITAIMEGRTPGPPKDWQKAADAGSGPSGVGKPTSPPIGGPAAQH
jgi:cell division protease FtsH